MKRSIIARKDSATKRDTIRENGEVKIIERRGGRGEGVARTEKQVKPLPDASKGLCDEAVEQHVQFLLEEE